MSKILLINGNPNEHGCTFTALSEIADTLFQNGVESELLYLGKKPMAGCFDCGKCFQTGRCVFDDQVNKVLEKLDEYDGIVVGSPVYYAGPSGHLCAFLDRLFYCSESRMAGKLGAAVVSCRRGGASAAFDRLNKYFGISNMHIVGSQYWNQVHGFTPDDVRKDGEGLGPFSSQNPKGAGKHPWGLPALATIQQARTGRSMAAHKVRRSSRPLTASAGFATCMNT